MYNAMVVLGIQHSDSVVYTCMSIDVCVCVYIYTFSDSFPLQLITKY